MNWAYSTARCEKCKALATLEDMKLVLSALLFALGMMAADQSVSTATPLNQVKKVYMLAMRHGMDQYLANELTERDVFEVVTDPKLADAVFTDRLGESFEQKLAELAPRPATAPAVADDEKAKDKGKDDKNMSPERPVTSSFAAGRGNVFLVDIHSRTVLWSTFRTSKSGQPNDMKKAADHVVQDLERALHPKQRSEPGSGGN